MSDMILTIVNNLYCKLHHPQPVLSCFAGANAKPSSHDFINIYRLNCIVFTLELDS